jgi:hypothetical protein
MIPKVNGNFIDNIYMISPIKNGRKILSNVFKSIVSILFNKKKTFIIFNQFLFLNIACIFCLNLQSLILKNILLVPS